MVRFTLCALALILALGMPGRVSGQEKTGLEHAQGEEVLSLAFSPDGRILATAGAAVRLWEVNTGKQKASLPHDDSVYAVAFSPDGQSLATAGAGFIQLWDVATRTRTASLDYDAGGAGLVPPDWHILDVAFSPDGRAMGVAGSRGIVRLWDVDLESWRRTFRNSEGSDVHGVAFSPDGQTLAQTGGLGVRLWNLENGGRKALLAGAGLADVAFSPDGRKLASADNRGLVQVWDVDTETVEHMLNHGGTSVFSVAFSPDGQTLATGRGYLAASQWDPAGEEFVNGQALLWDVDTGKVKNMLHHDGYVYAVAFSPDGRRLASGGVIQRPFDVYGHVWLWKMTFVTNRPNFGSADFDDNGIVNFSDFLIFAAAFGKQFGDPGYNSRCDLDGDFLIGFSDFVHFASHFGS